MATHKARVEIRGTKKGKLAANTLIVASEYFNKKTIQELEEQGYLLKIEVPKLEDNASTTSKTEKVEEPVKNIDDMSEDEINVYAKELGINTEECEDINAVIDALIAFDYSSLNKEPLKKHALILGANLEGLTKKEEYAYALKTYLDDLDSADKE